MCAEAAPHDARRTGLPVGNACTEAYKHASTRHNRRPAARFIIWSLNPSPENGPFAPCFAELSQWWSTRRRGEGHCPRGLLARCLRRRPPARSCVATARAARHLRRRCCSAPSARPRPTAARRARWETPAAPAAHSAPYASACSPAPAPFPPDCTPPPPPDCRVEGRAQAQVRCSGAGRGGGEAVPHHACECLIGLQACAVCFPRVTVILGSRA